MNNFILIVVIVGVFLLIWKYLDYRKEVSKGEGFAQRKVVRMLLVAFTLLVGFTSVFAEALFEFLGLEQPAQLEYLAFAAFVVFSNRRCTNHETKTSGV